MRTTIDIPDQTYRDLKVRAAREGKTMRQMVLEGVELARIQTSAPRKPFTLPLIPSSKPGTLELTNEQIDDILFSS
ncbi:MAG TPA: hypothetical protein VE291_05735 [Terracidiphilus sp.]|jgi:hypothetical protein|nr:hypothetical protein [Terracidiphilus sp.]